jgi:hypothetical protein
MMAVVAAIAVSLALFRSHITAAPFCRECDTFAKQVVDNQDAQVAREKFRRSLGLSLCAVGNLEPRHSWLLRDVSNAMNQYRAVHGRYAAAWFELDVWWSSENENEIIALPISARRPRKEEGARWRPYRRGVELVISYATMDEFTVQMSDENGCTLHTITQIHGRALSQR